MERLKEGVSDAGTGHLDPVLHDLASRQLGALSGIRGRLLSITGGQQIRSFLVTSGLKGEGKTTVAVTLAMSFANAAERPLLLMEGNFQAPRLHKALGLAERPGLADLLRNGTEPADVLQETALPNLYFLALGNLARNSAHLFDTPKFAKLMELLRDKFGNVIVDGPPMLTSPDSLLLVPHFDGVIQVVRCEQTKQDVTPMVKDRIESVGGTLLGAVLNRRKFYVPRFFYGKI